MSFMLGFNQNKSFSGQFCALWSRSMAWGKDNKYAEPVASLTVHVLELILLVFFCVLVCFSPCFELYK
jgi:hypothetical protein